LIERLTARSLGKKFAEGQREFPKGRRLLDIVTSSSPDPARPWYQLINQAGPMNRTSDYLQSDYTAEKGIEIGALVNHIIADAIHAGASDVHLEPWENTFVVRIRLSGVLTELVHLPLDLMEKISGRFKVMADLISYQTGLPQEGHASGGPETGRS